MLKPRGQIGQNFGLVLGLDAPWGTLWPRP